MRTQTDYRGVLLEAREVGLGMAFREMAFSTPRGAIAARYYPAPGARLGVLCVGGIGGGWDTPATELYPRLAEDLRGESVASLRVRFRNPHALDEAVCDVLAGVAFLDREGIDRMGLIGHSFGGAAVIQAAAIAAPVRTVVVLATQSYGTEGVSRLAPRCSILLLHGSADMVLPPQASEQVYQQARGAREIVLYPGTGHMLNERAEEVYRTVRRWLLRELGKPAGEPRR